jgi:4-hydroxythreonine-4-phosphate dehydrogenase
MTTKPVLAITMGDPAGVGPEVCLQLLANAELAKSCTPVVFGDAEVMRACAKQAALPFSAPIIAANDWPTTSTQEPSVVDLGIIRLDEFKPGTINAVTGRAGYTYVNRAIDAALARQVAAVSTAPLNKEAMSLGGIKFPGHTEIFAARTNAGKRRGQSISIMIRTVSSLRQNSYELPKTRCNLSISCKLAASIGIPSRDRCSTEIRIPSSA